MIGAIIGDIVGSRFEFNNHKSKEFELFADDCRFTDDSVMTLAVAKAIMEFAKQYKLTLYSRTENFEIELANMAVKQMQEIGRNYPHCGFGGMFYQWIFSDDPKPYNSFGNGAAMRISSVGFIFNCRYEAEYISKIITAVTHNHEEGIKGAEATVAAIAMARRGSSIDDIRDHISSFYYPLDFKIDDIRSSYLFNETCQDTVPQAIECFLESTSFEDAIRTAISLGGDSDTIGAITGAIAEAYYGVPEDIKDKALCYLDDRLRSIYDEWENFTRFKSDEYISEIDFTIRDAWLSPIINCSLIFDSNGAMITFNTNRLYEAETHFKQRYSLKEAKQLRKSFSSIHTELWDFEYEPVGYSVLDGTSWSLSVRYTDGSNLTRSGRNAWPENWNMLLDYFGIENDSGKYKLKRKML